MIITAAELIRRLPEGRFVPVDVRPEAAWREATIPGAVSLNVYDYFIPESDEAGIAGMAAGAKAAFERLGIGGDRIPVFFEEQTGMISPRGLWFHELVGLEGGLILDGGIQAWKAASGATAPGEGTPEAISQADGAGTTLRRDLAASTDEVLNHAHHAADIFDVRRKTEFEGTFLHPCCARPGRIPHAHFAFYEDLLLDGKYRPASEIRQIAEKAGLSTDREIITYCHRGARAATALYGLRLAGFDKVKIYVGSWHEWAGNSALPLEIGPAEEV
ncbi:thiosulfate/3-mercaptopyruvate sulfurtransferase [Rhizobium sp. NFR07]|uniref:sulfurtransferase n=1 Tax=Rhizobium sp. NFR07 TaxID=1566262 RepID=UPI0008E9C45F|nr:rhodanese-like domain-containing protein [Rhizobium sp. NFR07]SFB55872.1 thiosulfate/3-mercaptopyruvate sulfurtransferase [Rhizobium sp. NFR07]